MSDLVSVIVPVYNAEQYLEACLESIVNQTYKNLDIILVDDGSTDESGRICDEYASQDARIRVFHQENGMNGGSRNAGLSKVLGQWIVWVDSDDIIHNKYVDTLYAIAQHHSADIVVGNYCSFDKEVDLENVQIDVNILQSAEKLTEEHIYNNDFVQKRSMILTVPWGKIYRKEVYEGILYPSKILHDDTWTTWKTYENAKKIVWIPIGIYYWRNNKKSISRVNFDKAHFTGIDAYAEQLEYFISKKKQRHIEIVFAEYLEMFFWCYNRMHENQMNLAELKPYMKYMRKHIRYLKITKSLGLGMWVKYRYLMYYKIPKILK